MASQEKNEEHNETRNLETERLILRKIKREDVDAIYNCWMRDEDVSRYMFWKASDDYKEAEAFVEFELGNITNDQWNRWIIVTKEYNEIIGTCLLFFDKELQHWDISYNLGKKYWGNGYVTEAMMKVMNYGKCVLGMKQCKTTCASVNTASAHVIEKLGFQYMGNEPYECNGGTIITEGRIYQWEIYPRSGDKQTAYLKDESKNK